MKKKVLSLLLLLLSFNLINAQEENAKSSDSDSFNALRTKSVVSKITPSLSPRPNFVKMNLTSLLFGNLSFQYERVLIPHLSGALGLRIMPKQGLPMKNTVLNIVDNYADVSENKSDIENVFNNLKINGFVLTPELRFYLSKKNKGLYLGAFGRYEQYKAIYDNIEFDLNNDKQTAKLEADYTSLGLGLQIGVQFKLAKRVYLDWWILGPYATNTKIQGIVTGYNIRDDQFSEFEEELNNISFDNDFIETKINVGKNSSSINMNGNLAGIRAMGIALAFRF